MNKRVRNKGLRVVNDLIIKSLHDNNDKCVCSCSKSQKPNYITGSHMYFYNMVNDAVLSGVDFVTFVKEEDEKILKSNLCFACKKQSIEYLDLAYAYFNEEIV